MNIKGILVLLSFLTLYFGISFLIYFFLYRLFSIERREIKIGLGICLAFLSLGFIFFSILAHLSDLFLVKILYLIASFWMGYSFMLFISLALGWIIYTGLKYLGLDIGYLLGMTAMICSFVWGVFGVWNAFNPVISKIQVSIKNLPYEWEGKKILQISDVHLGKNHGKSFAEMLVKKINTERPELVFITGDLFDGMGSKVEDFLEILDKIDSRQGVYFVTGNHEGYLGSEEIVKKLKKTKIKVLQNELIEIDGVQVIGLSYPEFGNSQDKNNILEEISGFNPSKASILLYHMPTSIRQEKKNQPKQQSQAYWKPDTDYSLAKNSGIDLQLSGHTHAGQFFPFTCIGKKVFNGFNHGLITDGDFNIYISGGVGTWGPPIRTVRSEIVDLKLINK